MPKKKEGERTVVHAFVIKPSLLKEVRQAAFDSDMSISKYICNALRQYKVAVKQALKTNSETAKVYNDTRHL